MVEEPEAPRIALPMPRKLLARIEDFRFERRLPSRAAAIRRLIETGLSVEAKHPKSKTGS